MPYPRSPILLKGALVEFSERLISAVPNVIIFQYNPETMTRTIEPWTSASEPSDDSSNNQKGDGSAQPGDPPESFSLVLELDAADALERPELHPVAFISGVADRIAAIELLMYPQNDDNVLLGSVNGALSGAAAGVGGGAKEKPVPRGTVPVVLFVWGPGRIIPVRVSSLSIEEQAYSPTLFPIRAKVSITLKVLQPKDIEKMKTSNKTAKSLATYAYKYTKTQKQVLATANIANGVESILSMLPI